VVCSPQQRATRQTPRPHLADALRRFEALGYPYWLACVQADLGEWLVSQGRSAESQPLLTAAARTSAALTAMPQLERFNRAIERANITADSA
jgi:hypothetical protein